MIACKEEDQAINCSQCGVPATDNHDCPLDNLQHHAFVAAEQKVYECDRCDFVSTAKERQVIWKHHVRRHTGLSLTHFCDTCAQDFPGKHELQQHTLAIHLKKEKAQRQQQQPNNVQNSGGLRPKHSVTSVTCRVAVCDVCRRRFVERGLLWRHVLRRHFDEDRLRFRCDECSFETAFRSYLLKHIQQRHLQQKPECSICRLRFTRKYFYTHYVTKHTSRIVASLG